MSKRGVKVEKRALIDVTEYLSLDFVLTQDFWETESDSIPALATVQGACRALGVFQHWITHMSGSINRTNGD